MTYPMWGYSSFLIIANLIGSYSSIIIIQFIMCYLSIVAFYKTFTLDYKNYHLLLLLPYIALCSVKWNDAIVGSMLIFYIYFLTKSFKQNDIKSNILAGLILGIILNLRSEYLFLLPLQFIAIISIKSVSNSVKIKFHSVIYLTSILTLLPWGIRNYIEFDELKLSSSNGASVMYISLGQLDNNSWGIKPVDNSAFLVTKKYKVKDPYSIEGESILRKEFLTKVEEDPAEYILKCLNNALDFVIGGVYTGEYGSVLIQPEQRQNIDNRINSANGLGKFEVILKQDFYAAYPILIEKIILLIYRIVWLSLIMLFIYALFKQKYDALLTIILIIFIHKLLIVSGIQYEYRHINSIYLPVLGIVLKQRFFQQKPQKKLNVSR